MSKYYLTNRNGDYITDRDENYYTIRKLRGSYENLNIVEIDSLSVYDLNSNNLIAYLDELQSATISHTEDKEDITGKNGRKISSLKRNKRVRISGTNGLLSAGILQAQIGSKFEQLNSAQIKYEEIPDPIIWHLAGGVCIPHPAARQTDRPRRRNQCDHRADVA